MAQSTQGTTAKAQGARLNAFQITTFALCAVVAMIDGFDTQSVALAAPDIAAAWNIAPAQFGGVFASGLLGALFGALIFGTAADRFGRKPSLLVAILLFGVVNLATPYATNLDELMLVRFITGLGLGGALPGVIAVTSEYAPANRRATIVGLMFCGFPLGAVIGGVVAAQMMPAHGWEILFYLGGIVPLMLLPVIALLIPESVRFLALRGDHARVEKLRRRMNADPQEDSASGSGKASIMSLFRGHKALGTFILTLTFLLSLMLAYFLVNWLPILARQAGVGMQGAVLGVAALNLGAILGCLVIGRLADRHGPAGPIGWGYAIGALAIALVGLSAHSTPLLLVTCFVAGALAIGAQMCLVALGAIFYDTEIRATGVGWLLGTGRIGAILGPILGGLLIARGVTASQLFLVAGGVSLLAALGAFAMGVFVLRKPRRAITPPASAVETE
ncbi:MFS transporter [Asticcacaulis sp.]|uniref:MFS transporter n=1 Tax=Asticcacaulis sp. TaxID=1872648 RepID=UPI002CE5E311|nr:MFS transporter [Asticcacaulis sp.]HTM81595.1 MFS transporter [Asticcacaulis sp.]